LTAQVPAPPQLPPPVDLAARHTPIRPADRLAVAIGLAPGQLWFKRDDLTGVAGGGNKARKLELLVGDALAQGCDVLVTAGAAQSNHVRATGSAACASGLDCVAILAEPEPKTIAEGNLVLDDLFGTRIVWTTGSRRPAAIAATIDRLRAEGRRPYWIPLGGSSPVGAAAYATCATEIELALDAAGSSRPLVVTAVGTGGTHAGLVAGLGDHSRVHGVDVAAVPDVASAIPPLADAVADLLGREHPTGRLRLDSSQAGVPYGEPTDAVFDALRLVATTEGVVLDPVYSGRAMAALIDRARAGEFDDEPTIVFVHTGGMPALFTARYADRFAIRAL
jgi:D-cysteine desulfhydrase family pyridoxal phosphate-dependent enzyme